jgi:hypothetical protein
MYLMVCIGKNCMGTRLSPERRLEVVSVAVLILLAGGCGCSADESVATAPTGISSPDTSAPGGSAVSTSAPTRPSEPNSSGKPAPSSRKPTTSARPPRSTSPGPTKAPVPDLPAAGPTLSGRFQDQDWYGFHGTQYFCNSMTVPAAEGLDSVRIDGVDLAAPRQWSFDFSECSHEGPKCRPGNKMKYIGDFPKGWDCVLAIKTSYAGSDTQTGVMTLKATAECSSQTGEVCRHAKGTPTAAHRVEVRFTSPTPLLYYPSAPKEG